MNDLKIKLQDYSIVLSRDLTDLAAWISDQSYNQYFVLTDENTDQHCWPLLNAACSGTTLKKIVISQGEEHKNLRTCEYIWTELLEQQADRSSLVINLGGGVVGDMGGFAASCFKRGIDFINIPTTVLSQVDASIGGKLGVDFNYGKNLIGMFKNPKRVHLCTAFHDTLSDRQYMNGFAEIFKHAIIGSEELWKSYSTTSDLRGKDQLQLLQDALMVKKLIVEKDPFEKSKRKALNFGHTIGHAVEAWSIEHTDNALLHGEAIAIGMIMETYLSHTLLDLPVETMDDIVKTMMRHYPYRQIPSETIDTLWQYMKYDKKNVGDKVMAVLIEEIAQPKWDIELQREHLEAAIMYYQSLSA